MIDTCVAIVASVTVASVALTAITVRSIEFAKWCLEREDRLAAESQPLTPEIRKLRRETLLHQREQQAIRVTWLVSRGFSDQAREHEKKIDQIDRELSQLELADG